MRPHVAACRAPQSSARKHFSAKAIADRLGEAVRIRLRPFEQARDCRWEFGFRDSRAQFAVSQRVIGPGLRKAERRGAACHRLQEGDSEALAGGRHDEEISHAIGIDEALRPELSEEMHSLADLRLAGKRSQGGYDRRRRQQSHKQRHGPQLQAPESRAITRSWPL